MVVVAQLVRALDCGSRGRRFDSGQSPIFFYITKNNLKLQHFLLLKHPLNLNHLRLLSQKFLHLSFSF